MLKAFSEVFYGIPLLTVYVRFCQYNQNYNRTENFYQHVWLYIWVKCPRGAFSEQFLLKLPPQG